MSNTEIYTHLLTNDYDSRKFRHELPNMYDDDLNPYEYRLIGHYVRVGICWQSTLTTSKKCQMSTGMVSQTRKSLIEKGFLNMIFMTRLEIRDTFHLEDIIKEKNPDNTKKICVISVVDKWLENYQRFSQKTESVHAVNVVRSSGETKNNPIKKKKDSVSPKNETVIPEPKNVFEALKIYCFNNSRDDLAGVLNLWLLGNKDTITVGTGKNKKQQSITPLTHEATIQDIKNFAEWWTSKKTADGTKLVMPKSSDKFVDAYLQWRETIPVPTGKLFNPQELVDRAKELMSGETEKSITDNAPRDNGAKRLHDIFMAEMLAKENPGERD